MEKVLIDRFDLANLKNAQWSNVGSVGNGKHPDGCPDCKDLLKYKKMYHKKLEKEITASRFTIYLFGYTMFLSSVWVYLFMYLGLI